VDFFAILYVSPLLSFNHNMDTQSVTASVASSVVTERGVRVHVKKQLALDIETNGGIKHFAGKNNQHFYHLLQSRISEDDNPYGIRGDPIRTKLRKQVNYWVQKDRDGTYVAEVLNPWLIVQFSQRTGSQTPLEAPSNPVDSDSDDESISSSESTSSVAAATARRNPKTSKYKKPERRNPKTPPKPRPLAQLTPPPKQVVVDRNSRPPTTPLTPLGLLTNQFAKMSTNDENDNKGKRKIGTYEVAKVLDLACKYLAW
jgi:hypothetical protein